MDKPPGLYYRGVWESAVPRSNKANLPWIDIIGTKIAGRLSERHARPMIYRQSGPYNQSKTPHVGVFFNDPILYHVMSVKSSQKVDFRFGYCLERSFSAKVFVGFVMGNPTLSSRFLMPRIRTDRELVASKLIAWLRRHAANGGYVRFGIGEGESYSIHGEDDPGDLAQALGDYANPKTFQASSPWKRTGFSAIVQLPE